MQTTQSIQSDFRDHVGARAGLVNMAALRPTPRVGGHIMVIDPYDDNRDLYADWFRFLGFRVTACSTAAEASETVFRDVPNAVIISVRLRGEDSLAFCDMLKNTPQTAGIPLIAISSATPDLERAVRDGRFAAVVMIPCSPDTLLNVLASVLTRKRREPAHVAA